MSAAGGIDAVEEVGHVSFPALGRRLGVVEPGSGVANSCALSPAS